MAGQSDWDLLERYARDRDEQAFAQVVRRHTDMVYSAALRRVGRPQWAEDVAQATFIILARKAASLKRRGALGAWLLTVVRYSSANLVRIESARRRHEGEAAMMRKELTAGCGACSTNPSEVLMWQEIAACLDDAVLKLPESHRRLILLRYFEDCPMREIARDLRVSDVAARQRVHRALDALRKRLVRHGAMLAQDAKPAELETLMCAHAVRAAPAGLAGAGIAATMGSAVAGANSALLGNLIAKGAMKMMAWTKIKLAAVVVGAIVIGGAGGAIGVTRVLAQDQNGSGPLATTPAARLAAALPLDAPSQPLATPQKPKPPQEQAEVGPTVQHAPPVVVRTVPESGDSNVDPSTTEIKVTYSKAMQDGSWSWSTWGDNTTPKITGKPHYLDDHRTCVLPVKLEPGHTYAFWLNSERFGNFKDIDGRRAVPYLLIFQTR